MRKRDPEALSLLALMHREAAALLHLKLVLQICAQFTADYSGRSVWHLAQVEIPVLVTVWL